MGFFSDLWDDFTGATAAEKAEKRMREAQVAADNQAAEALVFAETEGQGKGSIGELQLGIEEDIEEDELDSALKLKI